MNTDLKHGKITDQIIRVFYEAYNELGHGFLESVYQKFLVVALTSAGCAFAVPLISRCGFADPHGQFEANVLVENCVLKLRQRPHWFRTTEHNF